MLSVAATLLPGAVPAAYAELAAAAVCAVEEAGEMPDAVGGAVATDVLEATVEMLQPGQPTRAPLARAFAAECGGPAAVLAPLARPHAETRALAIRLLAALLPRSRNDGGGPGSGTGAHASAAVGFEKFAAAPGAFVHSISSTFAGGSSGGAGAGGSGTGTASGSSRSLQAPPGLFAAVAESLLMYPLTPDIRAALFELVLGGQPVPAPRAPADRDSREGKTLKSRAEAGYRAASKVASAAASKAARFMGGGGAAAATTTGSEFGGALLRPDADASSRGVPGSSTPPPRGFFFACSKSVRTRRCARVCSNSCSGSWRARPPTRRRSSNKPGGKSGSSRAREDDPANANPGRTSGATATRTPRSAN